MPRQEKRVKEGTARESKKLKDESIQKVIIGDVDANLGLDIRIISAVPEDVAMDQTLTISADANVKSSLWVRVKAAVRVLVTTTSSISPIAFKLEPATLQWRTRPMDEVGRTISCAFVV